MSQDALRLIKLEALAQHTSGSSDVRIGLIDGHVNVQHVGLKRQRVEVLPAASAAPTPASAACMHGTFIAGMLCGDRAFGAPALCSSCTLLVRPLFRDSSVQTAPVPAANPAELACAVYDCVAAGARIINLSLGPERLSTRTESALEQAFDHAMSQGVIVVAAAGNQGTIGSSAITRHPWVIPVVACGLDGRPMDVSNLGPSIGKRGLMAPGYPLTSLAADGDLTTQSGTSVAAPFVTAASALLWSMFPNRSAVQIKLAVTQASGARRTSIVPPLLDAAAALRTLGDRAISVSQARALQRGWLAT